MTASRPRNADTGDHAGHSEDTTADNLSSPNPGTPGDHSEDTPKRA
jgi:hypothetical protein